MISNKFDGKSIAILSCITFLFLIVVGIANKQISYILIECSIFKWLRDFIAVQAYEGSFSIFFLKLHELFNCPLCMTGQIGLWLTLFLMILAYKWWPFKIRPLTSKKAISFLLVWFVMAMALAGAGYYWWNVLEHKSRIAKAEEQYYAKKLEILRISSGDCSLGKSKQKSILSQEEFSNIFNKIADSCSKVCPCKRYKCQQNKMEEIMEGIAKKKGYSAILCQRLIGALQKCSRAHSELFSANVRESLIEQAYQQFIEEYSHD